MSPLVKMLMTLPSVIVLRSSENEAEIEFKGVSGVAQSGRLGICVGAPVYPKAPTALWIARITRALAFSEVMRTLCVSRQGSRWILWGWYDANFICDDNHIRIREAQFRAQFAVAVYFSQDNAHTLNNQNLPITCFVR
ncbi:hypothetical protein PQR05_37850 [Paraburkholderia sediminicola]|uniref:hypothetical protein n=1 Tax=Paraburkholderia sediminicola TaxID=458836 RepID=UPI0038B83656